MPEASQDEIAEQVRDHAWDWFALHAAQRMQTFNFFLVATAFLMAAYGSLLEKHPLAAAAVAVVGAWLAFWFTRLDARMRQLVKAGENVLRIAQARLAERSAVAELEIVKAVEEPTSGASTYRMVIGLVEWTIVVVFLFAAAYAVYTKHVGGPMFFE